MQTLFDLTSLRQAQEYFDRNLERLDEKQLREDSLLENWTRAHVVAHVALNAEAITNLIRWAQTGVEQSMYASVEKRNADIEEVALLPLNELKKFSQETSSQLDRAWQKLPKAKRGYEVRIMQGMMIPVSNTLWLRSRELWLHTLDLGSGAKAQEIPTEAAKQIIEDVVNTWKKRDDFDIRVELTDLDEVFGEADSERAEKTVSGTLAEMLMWVTGRTTGADKAPRWL